MKLTVASSPHIRGNFRTNRIMADVMLALTPALAVGVVRFGLDALILTLVCMASAVAAEWLFGALTRTRNTTVDGSALVTGMLLAMTLPHTCPLWLGAAGSVFAIVFVKCLCGGLGQNIFNPALAARAAMMVVYPRGPDPLHGRGRRHRRHPPAPHGHARPARGDRSGDVPGHLPRLHR